MTSTRFIPANILIYCHNNSRHPGTVPTGMDALADKNYLTISYSLVSGDAISILNDLVFLATTSPVSRSTTLDAYLGRRTVLTPPSLQ